MGCMGCREGGITFTLLGEPTAPALSRQGRTYGPSRDLCETAGCIVCAIQITQPPPPLILREPQHERPKPLQQYLCKGLAKGEGMDSCGVRGG